MVFSKKRHTNCHIACKIFKNEIMKKNILSAFAFVFVLGIAPVITAQTASEKAKKDGRDITLIISDLSADQKLKVEEINTNYARKITTIKSNESIEKEERQKDIKILRKQRRDAINSILTDHQKEEINAYYKAKKANKYSPEKTVQNRIIKMDTQLSLSADQKQKVEAILTIYITKNKELKENTALSEEQRKDQFKTLRKEQRQEIAKVLTEEQKEILKQQQIQRKEQKKEYKKK